MSRTRMSTAGGEPPPPPPPRELNFYIVFTILQENGIDNFLSFFIKMNAEIMARS